MRREAGGTLPTGLPVDVRPCPAVPPRAPGGGQADGSPEGRVRRYGRDPVSPFLLGPGRQVLELGGGAVTGFARRGRYAVMAGAPAAPAGAEEAALDTVLAVLEKRRLRPVFAAVGDPERYTRRGLHAEWMGDDASVDLDGFSLAGARRANVRHSVTSARRAGLRVLPWSPELAGQVAAVSAAWVAAKGGREFGFTMGTFDSAAIDTVDCRVAVDARGCVGGFVTWLAYDDGRARALDLTRRSAAAPNPTMDLLIADSLLAFAEEGVERASLGVALRPAGRWMQRLYPTGSLRWYKDKFTPRWVPYHMVVSSRRRVTGATMALARVCSTVGATRS